MRERFNNLVAGIAPDMPAWDLPRNVFSDSRNVRYRDGAVEKVRGYSQALGELSATPAWITSIRDDASVYYVYADLGNVWATDGATHTKVSTISYSAAADLGWSGGYYHGYLILTDGKLDPQSYQPDASFTNRVAGLDSTAGWSSSMKCEVIRTFKDYILALRMTESASYNPRLMRWSESALAGNLPTTWDYSDPANDSGRIELGQTTDILVDCLPLRDVNIVYKQQHTWLMQYIGGSNVFDFRQLFNAVGLLTENCAAAFGERHFVVTDHDVVIHDGNEAQSILDRRARSWLFNTLDSDNFDRSFVVADYRNREMLFCFPENGQSYPNLALAWNWQEGSLYIRELGGNMAHAHTGTLPTETQTSFDSLSGSFDTQIGAFDESNFQASEQYVVFADSADTKAYQVGNSETFNGTAMDVYALREALPLDTDPNTVKRVMAVYPKILGVAGDTVDISVGVRDSLEDTVTWSDPQTFTIGTDYKTDFRLSGRVFDIRFDYTGSNNFRLFSYDVEFEVEGRR